MDEWRKNTIDGIIIGILVVSLFYSQNFLIGIIAILIGISALIFNSK